MSVYILLLMGNSLIVSSMPIAMELAMDICYPAGEGVVCNFFAIFFSISMRIFQFVLRIIPHQVGGWISIWFNIATVGFLALFDIPGIGRLFYMPWVIQL